MKSLFFVFVMLAVNLFGVVVDVPRVLDSGFLDGESSQDTAFQSDLSARTRTFKIKMSFNAILTNNVQIAFGSDQAVPGDISLSTPDGCDGKLASEETSMIIGWDCGKYFLRPQGLRTRYESSVSNLVAGERNLVASINIAPDGTPKEIIFTDNGQKISFEGFSVVDNVNWLRPDDWSLLRVTTRGSAVAAEDVKISFSIDKMLIIIN